MLRSLATRAALLFACLAVVAAPDAAVAQGSDTAADTLSAEPLPGDTLEPPRPMPDSATLASAYLDPAARELVRLARERRRVVDRSIRSYKALARERISVGLRALRRDRTLWEREVASRIDWERDGDVRIEVLGAREVLPPVIAGAQVPGDLEDYIPHLAFDPADPFLISGWGASDEEVPHPLAAGSEVDYRFRSGGTTVIRLPTGGEVRLRELEVLPRRDEGHLVQGSFWLDEETHAVVQATFRLSDDLQLDPEGDAPALIEPTASLEYVTLEYALWDSKWWLPRIFAARGALQLGRAATLPVVYERTYTDFEVTGDPATATVALDSTEFAPGRRVRCPMAVSIVVSTDSGEPAPALAPDTAAAESIAADTAVADTTAEGLTEAQRRACGRIVVVLPEDTASLLTGGGVAGGDAGEGAGPGESLLTESELRSIREQIEALAPVPWRAPRPRFSAPWQAPGLVRYNRVEGLSLGVRAELDFGPLEAAATARLGAADLEPNGELAVSREGRRAALRAAAYRRLVPMDPSTRPFTLASSLSTLLLGRDEGDYYRTLGLELTGEPLASRGRWYDWRLYVQRERAADKETDVSLPHLFDEDRLFDPNAPAHEAEQVGGAVRLRGAWGEAAAGLRPRAEVGIDGAVGSFDYARPAVTLGLGFPLPGPLVGLVEGGAGTSFGHPALQHLWRVGGSGSLRGYEPGVLVGESFWRGRGEVSTELPVVRVGLFSDVGWAGPTDEVREARPLVSAGIGLSLLDGLVRLDLARALREPEGWRFTAYVDAWQ